MHHGFRHSELKRLGRASLEQAPEGAFSFPFRRLCAQLPRETNMPTPIGIIGDFLRRAPGDENTNHDFEAVIKGNPGVQDAMTRAMADSRPTARSASVERGVEVRRNARGDVWAEPYFPTAQDKEREITPPQRAMWEDVYDWLVGVQTIGTAHSHLGGSGPSPVDRATAGKGLHVPGVIMSPNGLYYHGPAMPPKPVPGWQFWK